MATFRKLPSGRRQAQVRIKGHKPVSKSFILLSTARQWARDTEIAMEKGEYINTSKAQKTTMTWLFNKYLERFTPNKKSVVNETSRIKILKEAFGHLTVASLKADDIIEHVEERLETVVSDTVRRELATLSVVIKAGIAVWNLRLPANPCAEAKAILTATKTLKPGNKRDRRLSQAEENILLKSSLGGLIEFAVETAMRRGEIANMQRSHRKGNKLFIPETKTGVSRTIPLSSRAMAILDNLPAQIDPDKKVWGLTPEAITRKFKEAKGNIKDLRFHDLRHEATSRLFERSGLEIQQVAVITGHQEWATLKRYTHLSLDVIAAQLES